MFVLVSRSHWLFSFHLGCAKAGGVRFSEEPPSAGAPSHVHFDEKLHDSVVMVTPEDDGNFMVKVCSERATVDKP